MTFTTWKFRSMVVNAEDLKADLLRQNHRQDGPFFKMRNDPRVTSVGRVLRRLSLDELPQLWKHLDRRYVADWTTTTSARRDRPI